MTEMNGIKMIMIMNTWQNGAREEEKNLQKGFPNGGMKVTMIFITEILRNV
jgi:hypothetical protein